MKHLTFIITLMLSFSLCYAETNQISVETKWTHSWSEGEDASSTFYYFIEELDQVHKIRMLWNGGAQNKPSITDYISISGTIIIRYYEAPRDNIADITLGKNTGLHLLSESKILRKHTGMMLIPDSTREILNESERVHINNIIDILSEDRSQYKRQ